jgi:hypothetical protein
MRYNHRKLKENLLEFSRDACESTLVVEIPLPLLIVRSPEQGLFFCLILSEIRKDLRALAIRNRLRVLAIALAASVQKRHANPFFKIRGIRLLGYSDVVWAAIGTPEANRQLLLRGRLRGCARREYGKESISELATVLLFNSLVAFKTGREDGLR